MSDPKFTKGPWEIVGGDGIKAVHSGTEIVSYTMEYETVGVCGGNEEEALANTHLIVAAPDLYESLDNAFKLLDGWYGRPEWREAIISDVRKALAKARGEA